MWHVHTTGTRSLKWHSCIKVPMAELITGEENDSDEQQCPSGQTQFFFFFFNMYVFIYLFCLRYADFLVEVYGLLSCGMWTLSGGMHAGSSSPTRDQIWGPLHWERGNLPEEDHQRSRRTDLILTTYLGTNSDVRHWRNTSTRFGLFVFCSSFL